MPPFFKKKAELKHSIFSFYLFFGPPRELASGKKKGRWNSLGHGHGHGDKNAEMEGFRFLKSSRSAGYGAHIRMVRFRPRGKENGRK